MNNQKKLELKREQVAEFLKAARADLTEDDWKDADLITVLQWALPTYQKWTNHGTWNDTPPVPTTSIKPGDTRQLLHNTIKVMTDQQVQMVAKSLGLEVVE
ncbi:hypothetical protein [Paenibacillus sp. DMB20]|uniref:hypothetical protein n=1 Tax=Paenibacillus sp. DMB20 TaxID=1642570 RepID=UPI000627C27D|nr:hypothetical protein [Paenibacillus sp. DMB20]KKO51123.1 hypothetical protein XI25_29495 [Paenibacillus sp. DMB20]